MINAKQASAAALGYLFGLYPGVELTAPVLLEEVEVADNKKFWLITLSYAPPSSKSFPSFVADRQFKVLKIDATTDEVLSMKSKTVD